MFHFCFFQTKDYKEPAVKRRNNDFIVGYEGCGKSLMVGEWDGKTVWNGEGVQDIPVRNYAEAPSIKARVMGVGSIGDNAKYEGLKEVCVHDTSTKSMETGSECEERFKNLCTESSVQITGYT